MANIAMVSVEGDLDVTTVPSVRKYIDELIDSGCRRIVMNMAGAHFVDSAGMGLILTELRRMRRLGGLLSLINVSPRVYHSMSLMRMVDFMPVSRAGTQREVHDLDPSVLPEWRTTFRVDGSELCSARARLDELLRETPLSPDDIFDVTLACGEAIGNAVDHTSEGGVLATVARYPDRVVVDVADRGEGFEVCGDTDLLEVGKDAERGRGIKLMRLLVDLVSISPKTSGEGTVVHLVKLFPDGVIAGTQPGEATGA